MDRDLRTFLLADNPWLTQESRLQAWLRRNLPNPMMPRLGLATARSQWTEANRAHLLVGPRQAGKSTAIWAHLAERGEPFLFVDCGHLLVRAWCTAPPLVIADLESLLPHPVPLYFEEVQRLDEAGLFLKGLVDRRVGVPILASGSSAYHLQARTRESLAGRATRSRLLPFSFAEVCQGTSELSAVARQAEVARRLERHLRYGGYPAIWLSENPEIGLSQLVEAVLIRDASDLFRIARPDAFRRLLQLIAGQVGSLVNLTEWASVLGVSRDTVASYLEILESSHVVASISPYIGGKRAEVTSRPKVYLVDSGIRNRLLHDFRPLSERQDAGPLLENWIFSELWKGLPEGASLHFWRGTSGSEVDFVLARGDALVPIEVKVGPLPQIPRSFRSFLDAHRPFAALLVNGAIERRDRVGGTEVIWLRPERLNETVNELFSLDPNGGP